MTSDQADPGQTNEPGNVGTTTTRSSGRGPRVPFELAPARKKPGSRRRRKNTRKALLIALGSLLTLALIAGIGIAWYVSRIDKAFEEVKRGDTLLPNQYPGQPEAAGDALNIMLIGSDNQYDGGGGRSDVLMMFHLSGDKKDAYLISFPRDMWVDIPANNVVPRESKAKINAAYSWGGSPLAAQTMEQLTDVKVDHAAEIDLGGFMNLTTALGGVTVYNQVPSSAWGYTWPKGEITIQGDEAMVYVRQRYELPNGDLDRAERQRAVIQGIANKAMSPEVLANPGRYATMVDEVARYITVDQGLTPQAFRDLAFGTQIRNPDQIHSMQAPITGFGTSADGQSIALVDEPKLAELATAMREDKMADYLAKYPNG